MIPVFEMVKLDVCLSLEPFKGLDGRFDPSSTALTKRSQTLSNDTCVSRILSASVMDEKRSNGLESEAKAVEMHKVLNRTC